MNSTYSVRSGLRAFTLLAALGAGLAGCHTGAEIDAGRAFPMAKDQSVRADIQVLRDVTHITFTNTTATDLPAGVIWANSAYAREFPGLRVGDTITLDLREFRNQFHEKFRAGGFFSTERPHELVRVQIETPDSLIGLTVVPGELE